MAGPHRRLRPAAGVAAIGALALLLAAAPPVRAADLPPPYPPPAAPGAIRIATFNASLSRRGAGLVLRALAEGRQGQPLAVAEIVQRVRPDILLINEIDRDAEGAAGAAFAALLAEGRGRADGIAYPHRFDAPVNTGLPTGLDLDGDGDTAGPGDAQGWGLYPGQYGMLVLSRFPIDAEAARTFQTLLWRDMPGALIPQGYYPQGAEALLRLSSKSHWDVPVRLPDGRVLHVLASHPTPPVFDGREDRNGRRNHDEIRFWTDYLSGAGWMTDDRGRAGALAADALFVVLGDLNADPEDGDGRRDAVRALLAHPRTQDPESTSAGGAEAAAQGGANARHAGDPARDTADWKDARGPGNLRVDFVLPSKALEVTGAGVFWPAQDDPLHRLVAHGKHPASSDHRLVWVDIR